MNKRKRLNKTIRYRILDDVTDQCSKTTELFRQCVDFYISVLKENLHILEEDTLQKMQGKLEKLTHRTAQRPFTPYDLSTVSGNIPAYFRRSVINKAIGIVTSWHSNYERWIKRGKKGRPPAIRTDNTEWPVYFAGMYKEFNDNTVMVKLHTGKSWVWRKLRVSSTQALPKNSKTLSVQIVIKGNRTYLHRFIEKKPVKKTGLIDRVLAVDLNIDRTVVMTVTGRDGRVHKTKFVNTKKDNRRRKFFLDAITGKLAVTGTIPEEQEFCKTLWNKIKHFNDNLGHNLSRQIVNFAQENSCPVIVFEHLGRLMPDRGKRSTRLNSKLMYWLRGSIYKKTAYKAKWEGIWATRINPKNTSRLCSRHHSIFEQPSDTKRPVQNRFECSVCGYKPDADFNACMNIARRYFARDSYLKTLDGNTEAMQETMRFLHGCMNPLYAGPGNIRRGTDGATPLMPASRPYPGQVKVL